MKRDLCRIPDPNSGLPPQKIPDGLRPDGGDVMNWPTAIANAWIFAGDHQGPDSGWEPERTKEQCRRPHLACP